MNSNHHILIHESLKFPLAEEWDQVGALETKDEM